MPKRVLIAPFFSDPQRATQLRELHPDLEVTFAHNDDEILEHIGEVDAFFGPATLEIVSAGKHLQWIQVPSAGVENYGYPELVNSNLILTNARGLYGIQLADHTMAFILSFSRCFNILMRRQHEEIWEDRKNFDSGELLGKTLLIVGLGGAGSQTAQRACAFGMNILAVDLREVEKPDTIDEIHPIDMLDQLLPRADYVSLCCPLTPKTEKLFSAQQFQAMKSTAYLVTVARGSVVDTESLVTALEQGEIAGAALDVTEPEPLPKGHPLWSMPNCIITPHSSGQSSAGRQRLFELLCNNLKRFVEDRPLLNVVDKSAGF